MSFKSILITITFILFTSTGCAQPKYETAPGDASGQQSKDQTAADFSLHFQNSGLGISWKWEKMPTDSEVGTMVFKVFRANVLDGTPIEVDVTPIPFVKLWMPSMGHGSSPTTVTRIDTGSYRVSNVFFVMPGVWEIRFQVKDGSVVQDEAVLTITI